MPDHDDFRAFMARFLPTFMFGFFASLLAVALGVTLWVDSHWRSHPDNPLYTVVACGGLVLLLCLGHFALIRGRSWGIGVVIAVLAATLLMGLSLLGSGSPVVFLGIVLVMPLIALLVLNSQRHRDMRMRLVGYRQQRKSENHSTRSGR
ncbi:hypothetical protein PS627_04497 [Pseudomonas fluorescens]|uniref:hypothetical protein n=1 Tax=Pseudomonas fluorescens TaxID=294 RepID=UPI001252D03C|nr:hypothetical protein [Pseudomonas fluorescens]CAG8871549.1 hypothetical protein PS627_04497 [Pseudomonas fluorescens]VVP88854.1 hypothetical protein PS910_02687 [Pseudomonas fluorescens]